MTTQPTDLEAFEAWMRPLLHYIYYTDSWFWHEYKREHGHWPSLAMKARGLEMRAEWLKRTK
jgi:hypothetical protein